MKVRKMRRVGLVRRIIFSWVIVLCFGCGILDGFDDVFWGFLIGEYVYDGDV